MVAAAELDQRARLEAQLAEQDRAIAELRQRLTEAEAQARAATEAAANTAAADRLERQRLQDLAATLRQELEAKRRAAVSTRATLQAASTAPGAGAPAGIDFGRYHALVIGNANYAALPAMPEAAAAARVDQTNHQREQYVRRHWKREWLAPQNYHVCVNTALLGMDGAADLVTRLARERFADAAS